MYEFTNAVCLLGSSRDTALHLGEEELRYESRPNYSSTKQLKSA